MTDKQKQKPTGYDKYINWKLFAIPLVFLIIMWIIPVPSSMQDVGVEYAVGPKMVQKYYAKTLFNLEPDECVQWQMLLIRMLDTSVAQSSISYKTFMKNDQKWCDKNKIPVTARHLDQVREYVEQQIGKEKFEELIRAGIKVRTETTTFESLTNERDIAKAKKAGKQLAIAIGIAGFVILNFITEAMPLPVVSFCIGLLALMAGIFDRELMPSLYWSDATWFIMGSLMFAGAFVKTGVDRRIAMMMFGKLKNPSLKWVTLVIILVISPLTMFMSDHALAAMFLPIGIAMYSTAVMDFGRDDKELAKMLMICIGMAANLGGSLAPSGAARNIIMMSYTEGMYGVVIGFGQWCMYCMPFLILAMPALWVLINWRFKPEITNLSAAVSVVRREVEKTGGKWTRDQKVALIIFLCTLFGWITESNLILKLTGIRFGIGAITVLGAVAYILAGVVNWRDYQTRVDWGVVWLYAGAIIFGALLIKTGAAYWLARSIVGITANFGLDKGIGLLLTGNIIVGLVTQLMADGPACAAVGPVTLAMAGLQHPGSWMIPFTAMSTAIASSFAYMLVIGTPPNAIIYSSGYLEAKDYLRVGVPLWFVNMGILMLMTAVYWPLLGFAGLSNPFN
ncbi:MAG: DASS family sodium-coupled anion symporter [Thermodesulfobacteriota bacterium]